MAIVLDAGALIAVEKEDRYVLSRLAKASRAGMPVVTSSAAVAQVLRNPARQVTLERLLRGVDEVSLDRVVARAIGELLARTATADVVDAAVAVAARAGDEILTSDPADFAVLISGRAIKLRPV